jgi:hypothetical protein
VGAEVGGALASSGLLDGVEAGEGAWCHELLPSGEVVDGPHVVFGGVEVDPGESFGVQPASVEDEAHLVERLDRSGVQEVGEDQSWWCVLGEVEAGFLDGFAAGGLQGSSPGASRLPPGSCQGREP